MSEVNDTLQSSIPLVSLRRLHPFAVVLLTFAFSSGRAVAAFYVHMCLVIHRLPPCSAFCHILAPL